MSNAIKKMKENKYKTNTYLNCCEPTISAVYIKAIKIFFYFGVEKGFTINSL